MKPKKLLERLKTYLAALVVSTLFRLLRLTLRVIEVRRPESGESTHVYGHWHGDELLLIGCYVDRGMTIMASRSRDGELMKAVVTRLGYQVVRGSSSRGGVGGLKGMIDSVRRGHEASLAVDGPRGPALKVKGGILKLAQQSGAKIVVGASACRRKFVFKKAWNRCYLPLPFTECVIVYGEPMEVPKSADATELESLRLQLEKQLLLIKAEAENFYPGKLHSQVGSKATTGV